MSKSTYYDVLGVAETSTESDIKKAYRSLKFHPDRNKSDDALDKYKNINAAYETLSEPAMRADYDAQLHGGGGNGMPPGFGMQGGPDMGNLFHMFFGGGGGGMPPGFGMPQNFGGGPGGGFGGPGGGFGGHGGGFGGPDVRFFHGGGGMGPEMFMHQQLQRPPVIIKNIEITLEQAYTGCSIALTVDRWITNTQNQRETETATVYVTIPPGTDANEILLLREMGNMVNTDLKGDIKVIVSIVSHTLFVRKGLDLTYHISLSLKEALCGFKRELHHINGKVIQLNNTAAPTVIKPNYTKTVPGMGMIRETSKGNLIIEFEIIFPDTLTAEQMKALELAMSSI
jgi:DnaJ family protein B protein 4